MYLKLLLLFLPFSLLANELEDYLKQYVGRWVGEFTIHSSATNYRETFPVEQRYWWEGGQLHGLSVSDTDRGMRTAKSRSYIINGVLRSTVTEEGSIKEYIGTLHDGGLVWLSVDLQRAEELVA